MELKNHISVLSSALIILGLEHVNAQHQHNPEIQMAATNFVQQAINAAIESINKNKILNETTKSDITDKLGNVNLIIGFHDVFSNNNSFIEGIFEDLDLSNGMIEQYLWIKKINLSINNQPDDSFEAKLRRLLRSGDFQYSKIKNTLCKYARNNRF